MTSQRGKKILALCFLDQGQSLSQSVAPMANSLCRCTLACKFQDTLGEPEEAAGARLPFCPVVASTFPFYPVAYCQRTYVHTYAMALPSWEEGEQGALRGDCD